MREHMKRYAKENNLGDYKKLKFVPPKKTTWDCDILEGQDVIRYFLKERLDPKNVEKAIRERKVEILKEEELMDDEHEKGVEEMTKYIKSEKTIIDIEKEQKWIEER